MCTPPIRLQHLGNAGADLPMLACTRRRPSFAALALNGQQLHACTCTACKVTSRCSSTLLLHSCGCPTTGVWQITSTPMSSTSRARPTTALQQDTCCSWVHDGLNPEHIFRRDAPFYAPPVIKSSDCRPRCCRPAAAGLQRRDDAGEGAPEGVVAQQADGAAAPHRLVRLSAHVDDSMRM